MAVRTTHVVIGGIFHSCDGEDEDQRHDGGEPGQGGDLRDQLERGERRQASEAPCQALLSPSPFSSLTVSGCGRCKGSATGHIPAE